MPKPDIRRRDVPVGPLRDRRTITVGNDDFEARGGFICQAVGTGDVVFQTLEGVSDQTETISTSGTIIGMGNHPVLLKYVRGHTNGTDTTITALIVGEL